MNKIYIKNHRPEHGAGFWIYRGYASAWEHKGYSVSFFDNLEDIKDENYLIMTTDASVTEDNISIICDSKKTFL